MNLEQTHQEALTQLNETLEKLNAIEAQSLEKIEQPGFTLDLREELPLFKRILELFNSLANANMESIPTFLLNKLKQSAQQAIDSFERIQNFDPSARNPVEQKDNLIQRIKNEYDEYFQQIAPTIAYCSQSEEKFEMLERQAQDFVEKIEKLSSSLEREKSRIIDDATDALTQVQNAAAEIGVAQHTVHFETEVRKHTKARTRWLCVTAFLGFVMLFLIASSVYYYMNHIPEMQIAQLVQLAISKAVFFGVLSFALVWASRMYRAESHNLVVNQHRQNALRTFETFIAASGDDSTKGAVLLEATQCIFSHQPSGFAQNEQGAATSPRVLEIFRNLMPNSTVQ